MGDDLYLMRSGDSQDTLADAGGQDTLKLLGVNAGDVTVTRDASSLYLALTDGTRAKIGGWFANAANRIEQVQFGDGTVWSASDLEAHIVVPAATANAEVLFGTQNADAIDGLAGDDILSGQLGDDTLTGGLGNDQLDGGQGNDLYLFGRGDGQDVIADADATAGNTDTLRFSTGTAPNDVAVTRDHHNLYLSIAGTTDKITIGNWFDSDVNKVERVEFADGTVWDVAQLLAATTVPTEQADYLVGDVADNTIAGLDGSDQLYGEAGNDSLDSGAGDDTLQGGAGSDVLNGGVGNDTLMGETGNDIYVFGRGYGDDLISDNDGTVGNIDTIRLASDLTPADIRVRRDPWDLFLEVRGSADKLTISNWFTWDSAKVERVEFADGTVWTTSDLQVLATTPTDEADVLIGSSGNDTIDGLDGNDWIDSAGGDDVVVGGAGNDTITDSYGNDSIDGGAGNDVINDQASGMNVLRGGDGNDTITFSQYYSNNTVEGGAGDDVIRVVGRWHNNNTSVNTYAGGAGNDYLLSGSSADTYLFNRGDGQDTIDDNSGGSAGAPGVDTLLFGAGITASDIVISRSSDNLVLQINDPSNPAATDQITIQYWNNPDQRIEQVQFADGTSWTNTTWADGSTGDDIIIGNTFDNILDGGVGADTLTGGAGSDTYLVDNPEDVVIEKVAEGTDTVISSINYTLSANVENLTLTGTAAINATGNELDNTLTGNDGANVIDSGAGADIMTGGGGADTYYVDNVGDVIQDVGDGSWDVVFSSISYSLTDATLNELRLTGTGDLNGSGNNSANYIYGNTGSNVLTGYAGDDLLDGGAGADTLVGGTGNDTYLVDHTDDIVIENANEGMDTVKSSVTYTLGADVEKLVLTGSTAINGTGNALGNLLVGNNYNNSLDGGAGNDVLQGMASNDTITDTGGNNLFDGGTGNDGLKGGAGNDLFIGGGGNDYITTGTGADVVAFNRGGGTDTVVESAGQDNTLSLGGGIRYADLALRKSGTNLILDTGNNESLVLRSWYATASNHSVLNLQVIVEAMSDFDANSSDPLVNRKVQEFDFAGLSSRFDSELATNPGLTSWALSNALTQFQLSASDTAALGGDLAYQYGKAGSLTGIGLTAAQEVIGNAAFGNQAQTLRPLAGLQDGAVRLS